MNPNLKHETRTCDFCVVGGGLAGSFAALAAARHGAKVILIQDRPMLGGNASSEIRMWVRGAKGVFDRETGLISELEERNIRGNPTLVWSLFDATLYGMLAENPNVSLILNASVCDASTDGDRITDVTAWQTTTYTRITVKASIFADCSGDSILAPLCGAAYRKGREAKSEFGETLAMDTADDRTMGLSIILAARETDHPVRFTPPSFASVYPTDDSFSGDLRETAHAFRRDHTIGTSGGNLWWIELCGEMDSIYDADRLRERLLANVYGVWDHIKNRGDHGMENWDLEWVGFLPGKRESRRYEGDLIVTERDLLSGGRFDDEIAYGGWPMDFHNPYGMEKNPDSNTPSVVIPLKEIYGLPFRALYSRNIANLMFAGRNVSVSHVALSSTRVMATCSLLGQAAGTGAALAVRYGCSPREVGRTHIRELQSLLLEDGVFLPHVARRIPALTLAASVNLSKEDRAVLFNGLERPRTAAGENAIRQSVGDSLIFRWEKPVAVGSLRLRFDPDFERTSVSVNQKMRVFALKLHTGKDFEPVRVASTIVKGFTVLADGEEIFRTEDNFLSLVRVPIGRTLTELRVRWDSTNGADTVRLFSADVSE